MFTSWKKRTRAFRCRTLRPSYPGEPGVSDRQRGVPGFDQEAYSSASVVAVGAGGLNGEVLEGAARKGIGCIKMADGDDVETSNLNRQFFTHRDIGRNKAICLGRNLSKQGFLGTRIVAYPLDFQDAVAEGRDVAGDLLLVGVDNHEAREYCCDFAEERGIPALIYAVSEDANTGYVFVQEPGGPSFREVFGRVGHESAKRQRCRPAPAVKDILKVVGGLVLYAIDTLVTGRKRCWDYRQVYLNGFAPDVARRVSVPGAVKE